MGEQLNRLDSHQWQGLSPEQVLTTVVYELYNPISLLGSHLNRLTADDDPITEEEYDIIFEQMQESVRHLSKIVVNLKRYTRNSAAPDIPTDTL